MGYIYYNPNPEKKLTGDCTVRAISKVLDQDWDTTYFWICIYGAMMHSMPSTNDVWGRYLYDKGFRRSIVPDTCPDCYTVKDFSNDYPDGKYLVATEGHVIAVENGDYYDTWDSGNEIPIFYWRKE